MARNSLWAGIIVLSSGPMTWASDLPATETATARPTRSFDLKSRAMQDILRATVATQASTMYRVEPSRREKPDLTETLKVERPAQAKPQEPRLPERTRCEGALSCGLETLLIGTEDEEAYSRNFRDRLMLQGSIANPEGPGP